jgi:hypothetical protein
MGLAGVMWGTVITHFPITFYLLVVHMRGMKIKFPEVLRSCVFPSMLPIIIGYPVTFFLGRLLPDLGWFSFCGQTTILLIVYGGIAYRVSLTGAERIWFIQFLHKRKGLQSDLPPKG